MFLQQTTAYILTVRHINGRTFLSFLQHGSSNIIKQCGVSGWKSKQLAVTHLQTLSPFAPGTAQPCTKEG